MIDLRFGGTKKKKRSAYRNYSFERFKLHTVFNAALSEKRTVQKSTVTRMRMQLGILFHISFLL